MRILVLTAWPLLLPVAFAYHLGPGQSRVKLDASAARLGEADRLVGQQEYAAAVEAYDDALKLLPRERRPEADRIRLQRDKALMLCHRLPEAHADVAILVDQAQEDQDADPGFLADARSVKANTQYYMTWLMRLEGVGREVWEPEIESARQLYKLLAEQARDRRDSKAARHHQEDLEAAIRLARMDLSELQGLPLPSQ